ncbi:N-acetylglucosamine kinase [Clostridioides difficile]
MYFLGVDGGGTKTTFTLVDEELNIVGNTTKGTCHYNQIGFNNITKLLITGLEEVCKDAKIDVEEIKYTFVGLAGYGKIKEILGALEVAVKNAYSHINYTLGNDVEIALAGSLNGEKGINVIAGTGSIAQALDKDGNLHRCGGWGYRLGDEGSAYYIGIATLRMFTMQSDGRCKKTKLYDLIKIHLDIDNDYDIIKYVNDEVEVDRTEIAKFATICLKAAIEGDNTANKIFDDAAYELSRLIIGLEPYFEKDTKIKVSYSGGVFKSGDLILEPLKKYLNNMRFDIVRPVLTPDLGACLLAKKKYYGK